MTPTPDNSRLRQTPAGVSLATATCSESDATRAARREVLKIAVKIHARQKSLIDDLRTALDVSQKRATAAELWMAENLDHETFMKMMRETSNDNPPNAKVRDGESGPHANK